MRIEDFEKKIGTLTINSANYKEKEEYEERKFLSF